MFFEYPPLSLSLIVGLAIIVDYGLGEPADRYHPLVWFGRWAGKLECRLLVADRSPQQQMLAGLLAWSLALAPAGLWLASPSSQLLQSLIAMLTLYACLGARSLQHHVEAVERALHRNDLPLARREVGKIVSRQTESMTLEDVRRAAIESVLENGADAVLAPLFWFGLLGPFGAVLYRLANTLDAMWGYKNARYRHFGRTAARADDVLNWLPARLTAVSYALLGNSRRALLAWRRQAALLDSPNAGPVMTAGGGALNLRLGGPARYHDQLKYKPWFGGDRQPEDADLRRAMLLVYRTLALWWCLLTIGATLA